MCYLPNSAFEVSPDMHEMKNATNSAADEIKEWVVVWDQKEMDPSFHHATPPPRTLINKGPFPDQVKLAKAYPEFGAEVVLMEEGCFLVIPFNNLNSIWTSKNKFSLLSEELNADESQLCYSGTRGPTLFWRLQISSRILTSNICPSFAKPLDRTTLVEAWKCHEYEAAGRYAESEKITSGQAGVNFVNVMESLSASAQLYYINTTLKAKRPTVSPAPAWYLDSGATIHACHSEAYFHEYSPRSGGMHVVVANNTQASVAGIGTVQLKLSSGEEVILTNVHHVPKINKCLISVYKLDEAGFEVKFKAQKVAICKDGRVIGYGYNEGGMYRLIINNNTAGTSTSGAVF